MEKRQTAVEWFFDNLKNHAIQAEYFDLYQQAKEMEKEQIYKALCKGHNDCGVFTMTSECEKYYQNTYGN